MISLFVQLQSHMDDLLLNQRVNTHCISAGKRGSEAEATQPGVADASDRKRRRDYSQQAALEPTGEEVQNDFVDWGEAAGSQALKEAAKAVYAYKRPKPREARTTGTHEKG